MSDAEEKLRKELLKAEGHGEGLSSKSIIRSLKGTGGAGTAGREWPGLCGKCNNLRVLVYENGDRVGRCGGYRTVFADEGFGPPPILNPGKPVKDCSGFWPTGAPNLEEMIEQARLLIIAKDVGQYL